MHRTAILVAALVASVLIGTSRSPAVAQAPSAQTSPAAAWPERPVTMVVPFAAGGGTDLLGRIVGRRLSEILGQQVIIENVGGAGGMVGSARVVKAPPDGYQFVVGTTADAINQTLYKAPLYNFATDLVPAGLIGNQPSVLLTRKDFPAANFREFAAYAKANQSSLQFASAGTGSTGHLFCSLLNAALGINVTHVPYRGGGPAMQDLIAGRTDYICTLSPTAKPSMDGNLVKAMALLSRERSPMLPDLPTAHEQGLTDFDTDTWFGLFFPRGTPEPIVRRLNQAIAAAIDTPSVQEQLKEIAASVTAPDRRSPEYLRKLVESEIAKLGAAIRAAGISAN
jgi:tripartite-type tricarboxylate transporter receptor subunit TctC